MTNIDMHDLFAHNDIPEPFTAPDAVNAYANIADFVTNHEEAVGVTLDILHDLAMSALGHASTERQAGYDEGWDDGFDEGRDEGYQKGMAEAEAEAEAE